MNKTQVERLKQKIEEFAQKFELQYDNNDSIVYWKADNVNIWNLQDAIQDFNKILEELKIDPENIEAHKYQGLSYVGYSARVHSMFSDELIEEIKSESETTFDIVDYFMRGVYYIEKNQYVEALNDFNRVKELGGIQSIFSSDEKSTEEGKIVSEYYFQKFYEKSSWHVEELEKLTQEIRQNPKCAKAYKNRGYWYDSFFKNYHNALNDYLKALELELDDVKDLKLIAEFFKNNGKPQEAIKAYSKILEKEPQNKEIYFRRGICYSAKMGNFQKAIEDLLKAIEIDPAFGDAHYSLFNQYRIVGEHSKAIDICTKAIETSMDWGIDNDPLMNRATYYMEIGNYANAIKDYTKLINSTSSDYYYLKRSLCYYKMGEKIKALDDIAAICQDLKIFIKESDYEDSLISSQNFAEIIAGFDINFFLKVINILFDSCKLPEEFIGFGDLCNYFIEQQTSKTEIKKFPRETYYILEGYPSSVQLLQKRLNTDGQEIWLLQRKLDSLQYVAKEVSLQINELLYQENTPNLSSELINRFMIQQIGLTSLQLNLKDILNKRYQELVEKKEQEKAQARIEERNKIIADLSHSIKNLISTVIDPLENLKQEMVAKPQIIENALRGAKLVREIVNAMNLSFKGSIDDFRYDVQQNTGKDRMNVHTMLLESLKYSVGNIYDGKYFSTFQERYFPTEDLYNEAKTAWDAISSLQEIPPLLPFLRTYFFEPDIELAQAEQFVIGNEKGSAIKLLILFQELIFNAVKYSAFVKKEERCVNIRFSHDSEHLSIHVHNRFNPKRKAKTTGIGHVVIENFAKLLNTQPIITKENGIYSVKLTFENFWEKHT